MTVVVMQLTRDSIFEKSFKHLTTALIRTMESCGLLVSMRIGISRANWRVIATVRQAGFRFFQRQCDNRMDSAVRASVAGNLPRSENYEGFQPDLRRLTHAAIRR
jgi:hypothetical protein